jgi:hypothetical protein
LEQVQAENCPLEIVLGGFCLRRFMEFCTFTVLMREGDQGVLLSVSSWFLCPCKESLDVCCSLLSASLRIFFVA